MAGASRTVYAYSLAFNPVKAKVGREECGMKLLGVAELADGSLNFAFGVAPEGSTSSGNMLDTTMAAQPQLAGSQLPVRLPSGFQKKSPIPISTKRRELPRRSKEHPREEAGLRKPVAEDILPSDLKKEKVHVLHRMEENTSHLSQEAVSSQTSSRKSSRQSVPTRMKSKFVKQSPVPSNTGAVELTSKSTDARAGAKMAPRKVTSPISTSEISVSTRGDVAVDVSVQTEIVSAETARDHVAMETQTSPKATSGAVAENSYPSVSQDLAALNIQGLSVSISSQTSAEKGEEVHLESKAANVEALSNYKLADLKSIAKSRGFKGYSKLKKGELIELLSKRDH